MKLSQTLGAYARSPFAIASLAVLSAAAFALVAFGAFSPLAGIIGAPILWLLTGFIALQTPLGAKIAVASADAERRRQKLLLIESVAAERQRLSRLRLGDAELDKAQAYLVQVSGEYIEACRKVAETRPTADACLTDGLEVINAFLRERDEASTERRYSLEDQDPFPEALKRTRESLYEYARIIREERIQLDGGLSPESLMRVKEELR